MSNCKLIGFNVEIFENAIKSQTLGMTRLPYQSDLKGKRSHAGEAWDFATSCRCWLLRLRQSGWLPGVQPRRLSCGADGVGNRARVRDDPRLRACRTPCASSF